MTDGRILAVSSALALTGLLAGVGDARAVCSDGRHMTSYSQQYGITYLYFASDANMDNSATGPVIGKWWATGDATVNNGPGCPDTQWLISGPGNSFGVFCYIGDNAGFGFCDNSGTCPGGAGDVHVLVQTTRGSGPSSSAQFGLYRVAFTPAAIHAYDLSKDGTSNYAADIPRPTVLNSSRNGTNIDVIVRLGGVNSACDTTSDGYAPTASVTAYRLMEFLGTGDPGRDPALWTFKSSHPYTGNNVDVSTTVDCVDTSKDRFLAVQLSFDNGTFFSDYVGAPTRIACNPTLAEPGSPKLIPKQKPVRQPVRR